MKTVLITIAIAIGLLLAWRQIPRLFQRPPRHTVQVHNAAHADMLRFRLGVDGRTFSMDTLRAGQAASWEIAIRHDSGFQLNWEWVDRPGEASWSGGRVAKGPRTLHHDLRVDDEGGVVYVARPKPEAPGKDRAKR